MLWRSKIRDEPWQDFKILKFCNVSFCKFVNNVILMHTSDTSTPMSDIYLEILDIL